MRNTKYLIKEAKQNTNTVDAQAISDDLCVRLLNRIQDFIQANLANKNIENKLFRGQAGFTTVSGVDTYQLPFDVYAKNSVNNLFIRDNNSYSPVQLMAEKARGTTQGYFCSDDKIILSPMPSSEVNMFLSYTKKLPAIGRAYGDILSVATNTSLTLAPGYENMEDVFDDYFSVVDSDGEVIRYGLEIEQTAGIITLTDTTDILAGMSVVPGKYATTHCQLPDELEGALVAALEVLIFARLSSTDVSVSKAISAEFLDEIGQMFAENGSDSFMPPLTEYTEWV